MNADERAVLRQPDGDRSADAAACAGDESDPVGERLHRGAMLRTF
jgi:hypothetical protein